MNWHSVLQYAIGGAIVSWPPVLAGFWVNRRHVARVTDEQTQKIAELTDDQTQKLLPGRHPRPGPGYHSHGDRS